MMKRIPGVDAPASGGLAVLKPFAPRGAVAYDPMSVTRVLAAAPAWTPIAIMALALLWPLMAAAQSKYSMIDALDALWRWTPFLLTSGFFFNVLISFLVMVLGTLGGVVLGLAQISPILPLRRAAWAVTQLFRNSPWLVLLFIVMLAFPFEVEIAGTVFFVPDWSKAVIGLSLPIMANISEIVRGAIASVPDTQWEAAESLAFTRGQTLWRIILPQCFKRMIPPWMNWYAILTMATPLCSLLGVEELLTLTRQAIEAENNHPELLTPFYGFGLLVFFAYCYPIALWTIALERKFSVKL